MLRKIRIILAAVCFVAVTLLFLDFTGTLHQWFGWLARIQFLPAVLALNVAVVAVLLVLTLLFGRAYCSIICPLGVFQDCVSNLSSRRKGKKARFSYSKEIKWLRYGMLVLFVVALVAGLNALVALVAPYSAYGRMVQSLLAPVWQWGNNLLAWIAEKRDSYAFVTKEVWLKSLPMLIVAAATFIVVVVLAWRNGRTYCNTICPVGTFLSFFSRFAMFRPMIDKSMCRGCHSCEKKCKASCIDVENRRIDYSRCVDCFDCIDSCKLGGIKYRFAWGAGSRAGSSAAIASCGDSKATGSSANVGESASCTGSKAVGFSGNDGGGASCGASKAVGSSGNDGGGASCGASKAVGSSGNDGGGASCGASKATKSGQNVPRECQTAPSGNEKGQNCSSKGQGSLKNLSSSGEIAAQKAAEPNFAASVAEHVEVPDTGSAMFPAAAPATHQGSLAVEVPDTGSAMFPAAAPAIHQGSPAVEVPDTGSAIFPAAAPAIHQVSPVVEVPDTGSAIFPAAEPVTHQGSLAVEVPDTGSAMFPAAEPATHQGSLAVESLGSGRRAFLIGSAAVIGGSLLASLPLSAEEEEIKDKKRDGGFAEIVPKRAPARRTPITPFGSKSVEHFYRHCTACQLCVTVCPNKVLRPSSRLEHLMQPEMSFEKGYCRPECVKCSEVCPAGVILKITPEEKTEWKVGTASVDYDLCVVNRDGVHCGNCARHCPVEAIRMVRKDPEDENSLRIPSVNEAKCIGCGACENLCPSRPISAITVNGHSVHHNV